MNKLLNLDFSKNKASALPKWDVNCALVTINGSYNKLTTLEPLRGLKHLNNVYMDYNSGITFSGGDPLHPANRAEVAALLEEIHTRYPQKTIWLYTGFTWEELTKNLSRLHMLDYLLLEE